ncbi:phosphatase domain-containing protein [Rhodalgimonas zhirmunskyi]|uniref:Protein phosphatase n=1 Tax=Rhodalgimonas zhirmunskyi TaxID=2964767 RepID=A0AAJ1X5V7_9RHOB|nr:protein-tyrosine phosphatase family protein [Rhodoalgimonas zhirmunskyi]MDQ2094029.1 protein phosphatase [Rhodoalgimonas zhirmunskyi]
MEQAEGKHVTRSGEAKSSNLVVYALPVGGGTLALASLPGRDGDYRGDLGVFREWQPGIILSLVTEAEMAEVGGDTLGNDIQSMASRWYHLPVKDYGTPGPEFMAHWDEASRNVRRALKGGGRVIVHCKGGCGRSGMVALRLMVECGEDRFAALNRLRALRDCAVETKGQLNWAFEAVAQEDEAGG